MINIDKYKDLGLLILRLGVGIDFILFHGWHKLIGGPETWIRIGTAMPGFEVTGIYMFWGLMAALTETVGAFLFAIGFWFRWASLFLAITMIVAVSAHFLEGDPWGVSSHAFKMVFVFVGMMLTGAGKYRIKI